MKNDIASILKDGGIGVMASDTIYGLVGRALSEPTVHRMYALKKRNPEKPFIILLSDTQQLELFKVSLTEEMQERLKRYWPGPVSIILPCPYQEFHYLHRGTNSLAFRMPAEESLRKLIAVTGPLVAPSANPEGEPPAQDIPEAREYFNDQVDFYQAGKTTGKASKLIKIDGEREVVLRA